jgi:hypothetical protein
VVSFRYDLRSGFLELTLPSGRVLSYPAAELFEDEQYDSTSFTFLDASGSETGRMYHERRGSGAFGGLIFENIIQALCRDVFVEAMPRLEASGYRLVMHTHDEYVCEVPDGHGSLEEFLALITQPPSWAPELPIAAKTRISDRLIEIVEPEQAAAVITENIIVNALIRDEEEDDDEQDLEDVEIEPVELPASLMTDPLLVPEPHVYAAPAPGRRNLTKMYKVARFPPPSFHGHRSRPRSLPRRLHRARATVTALTMTSTSVTSCGPVASLTASRQRAPAAVTAALIRTARTRPLALVRLPLSTSIATLAADCTCASCAWCRPARRSSRPPAGTTAAGRSAGRTRSFPIGCRSCWRRRRIRSCWSPKARRMPTPAPASASSAPPIPAAPANGNPSLLSISRAGSVFVS